MYPQESLRATLILAFLKRPLWLCIATIAVRLSWYSRAPDLLNLAGRIELVSDGQLYRDGDSVTVRRQFNSPNTTPSATIIPDYAALIGLYDGLMGEFPDAVKNRDWRQQRFRGAKFTDT